MASYLILVASVWKPLSGTSSAPMASPCLVRRRSPSPPSEDDAARSFCASLSDDLSALEQSLGKESVSLRWSADAMRVLRKTQTELLALLRRSSLPIPIEAKKSWLDLYMEETAALLDLCNHLRSVAAAVSRYRMAVELAIQSLQNGSTLEMAALEAENQKLVQATGGRETTVTTTTTTLGEADQMSCDGSAVGVAMLAAKCTTVVISLVLVSAFDSPVSVEVRGEEVAWELPQMLPLAGVLASLVGRFRGRCCGGGSGTGVGLAEYELVRDSVGDLRRRLEREKAEDGADLHKSVEVLRRRSEVLKGGVEVFDAAVGEVFDEMIKGRNELLGAFRDEALNEVVGRKDP